VILTRSTSWHAGIRVLRLACGRAPWSRHRRFVVLALAAGTAGGVMRDVLIGATPPVALVDWRYPRRARSPRCSSSCSGRRRSASSPPSACSTRSASACSPRPGRRRASAWASTDRVGRARRAHRGRRRYRFAISWPPRPAVLRTEVYAIAAAVGSIVIAGAVALGVSAPVAAPLGALVAIVLRLAAMRFGWQAPRPR